MAKKHGKNTVITVDATDLSGFISGSDFNRAGDANETTVYGEDDRTYIGGLKGHTFDFEGFYDDDATGPPDTLIDALATSVAVVRQIEGIGTGLPNEAFSGILTAYDESAPVDNVVTFSASVQVSGAITRSDQA
jgi:hypothetical protein